jgi:hypothetical protein
MIVFPVVVLVIKNTPSKVRKPIKTDMVKILPQTTTIGSGWKKMFVGHLPMIKDVNCRVLNSGIVKTGTRCMMMKHHTTTATM